MTATTRKQFLTATLLLLLASSYAQDTRAFNQNASRSNHTRLGLTISPVFSNPINSNSDSLLFRGSGAGIKFGVDYFLGKVSIGLTSGFSSSSSDNSAINNFIKRASIPQDELMINKSNQQNMYLLIGPSIQFGDAVQLQAHAKGGLFINNSGSVSLQQKGAQRAAYRNEATSKSIYPGFMTGLNVQYAIGGGNWAIGMGADYLATKTEVNNYDIRRGGGVEGLKLSRNVSDIVAGVTLSYTIVSPRDASSGRPTGRRSTVANRDAASGRSTGRRSHAIVAPDETIDETTGEITQRDAASGRPTGRRSTEATNRDASTGRPTGRRSAMDEESCGSVTRKITKPDGSSEEMTFSCPADMMAYDDAVTAKKSGVGPVRWAAPEVLRSILVEADLDGDGTYETDVTSQISDEYTVDENGQPMQQKAGISTSRSNIRTKSQLQAISNNLVTCTATGTLNDKDVPLKIVYKSKHDTAKNSIGNIR